MPRNAATPVDLYVGGRVRMLRRQLGLTQEALGDKLGLTYQQVQKYERGANRITASRLQAIAQILRVPIPFFFEGAPLIAGGIKTGAEAPSPSYVSKFLADADGVKLVKAFMRIGDAKVRHSVVRLVKKLGGDTDDH